MKIKDIKEYDINRIEYDAKVQDIKKRKRSLKMLLDPDIIKKIKKDLIVEKRSAKRADRNILKKYIKEELKKIER